MKTKLLLTIALAMGFSQSAMAKSPINEMQACQAVLDFISGKLDPAPSKYDGADVAAVKKGLDAYNNYIQSEIVSPGLLEFNGGDTSKADAMQAQVDTYKQTLVAALNKQYPQDRLFTDHAVAINDCAKQAVPAGADLEALKTALQTMLKLAKLG